MQKKVFILGASVLQLPAIIEAKKMGLEVAVADMDEKAVGIPYADTFYHISTLDEEKIIDACVEYKADGIMTIATDMPMRTIAKVGEVLNLPCISYDTALKATDKGLMIKAFHENGVPAPWFKILKKKEISCFDEKSIEYPCIVKPIDSSGSRGVCFINNKEELQGALNYSSEISKSGKVIIEEYLDGDEISVETITINRNTRIIAITDKLTSGAPYFVELGHSQPSKFRSSLGKQIEDIAKMAVDAVGIINGVAHIEMKISNGKAKLIELGARLGGDCITSHLVPLSTGVSMVRANINMSLGIPPDISIKEYKGAAIRYIPQTQFGTLKEVKGVEEALKMPFIEAVVINKSVGDQIEKIKNSNDRLGFVIASAQDAESAICACEKALSCISYTTCK